MTGKGRFTIGVRPGEFFFWREHPFLFGHCKEMVELAVVQRFSSRSGEGNRVQRGFIREPL